MDLREFLELAAELPGGHINDQLFHVAEYGRNAEPDQISSGALRHYVLPFLQRAGEFGLDVQEVEDNVRFLLDGEDPDA